MGQSVSSEETTSLETNNHVQYQLMEDLGKDLGKEQNLNKENEILKSIKDTERAIQEGEYIYRTTADPSQKAAVGEGLEKLRDDLRDLHKMKEQSPLENLRSFTELARANQLSHLENLHKANMENLTYNNKELLNTDVTFLFNCCVLDAKKGMRKLHFKHSFVNSGLGKLGKGFQEIHHKYYSYYGRSCAYMNHPTIFQNFRYELVVANMNILCKEFSERYGIANHCQQDVRGFSDKLRSENNGVMYYAEKGGDGSLNFVVWW